MHNAKGLEARTRDQSRFGWQFCNQSRVRRAALPHFHLGGKTSLRHIREFNSATAGTLLELYTRGLYTDSLLLNAARGPADEGAEH